MNDFAEWIPLGGIVVCLIAILLLRKLSAAVAKKKVANALTWASRYYADQKNRDIAVRFVRLLEDQIHVPVARFTPQTRFLDDLGMDELEPVEVLMAVEEEFEIPEVSSEDAQKMLTIDDVIQYLGARHRAALAGCPARNCQ